MTCDNGSGPDDDYDDDIIDDNTDELTPPTAAVMDSSNRTSLQVSPQPLTTTSISGGYVLPPASGCASPTHSSGSPVPLSIASSPTSTGGAVPPQGEVQTGAD
jgi:hypothetical protein